MPLSKEEKRALATRVRLGEAYPGWGGRDGFTGGNLLILRERPAIGWGGWGTQMHNQLWVLGVYVGRTTKDECMGPFKWEDGTRSPAGDHYIYEVLAYLERD